MHREKGKMSLCWDIWERKFFVSGFSTDGAALKDDAETLRRQGYTVSVIEYAPGIWYLEGTKVVEEK